MRFKARVSLLALVVCALMAVLAPSAAQASFGVESFFAGNCEVATCGAGAKDPNLKETEEKAYRQAGGHVPFGVTDFRLNSAGPVGPLNAFIPEGSIKNVRVDVPAGVVTNPQAVPMCSMKDFEGHPVEFAPGKTAYTESTCPESSEIGTQTVTVLVLDEEAPFSKANPAPVNVQLTGTVYNLEQPYGLGADYGVALDLAPILKGAELYSHTFIEGNVEWGSDYHDYFNIQNIPGEPPLLESRLVFKGNTPGTSGFIRNPTNCSVSGAGNNDRCDG